SWKQSSAPNSLMAGNGSIETLTLESDFLGEPGTKPLTFTFVPSIGRLPIHFQGVDVSKLLLRTSEEPNSESSEDLTLKSGIRQDSESTYHTGTRQKIFLPKGYTMSKGEMQESDLFKAEFIFITDSDEGDEEAISRNNVQQPAVCPGNGHARCQLSRISTGGDSSKPLGDLNVPESQRAGLSHSATSPPKQRQMSTTLQRAAGRETRYVSPFIIIYILAAEMSYFTKPGVIRPGSVKAKSILKTEEPYQPNPFKKYLEETSDPAIEQVSALFKHYRPKIL
uniref:Muscular LMNA interacting protein n=1 Tax=Pelusios castaneus TaxID=367368 RepID=A0A8C8SB13_9SAUR